MSRTYSLFCAATKQKCWAGQSTSSNEAGIRVYGSPVDAAAIARFLEATAGRPVVLLSCDSVRMDWDDFEEMHPEAYPNSDT